MRHRANDDFWAKYNALPPRILKLADKNFKLLKHNPRHPSLQFKKTGDYWAARVGRDYRAVAVPSKDSFIWFWIGSHADYDKLIDE